MSQERMDLNPPAKNKTRFPKTPTPEIFKGRKCDVLVASDPPSNCIYRGKHKGHSGMEYDPGVDIWEGHR